MCVKKLSAEAFGTAALVFIGCGAVALGGFGAAAPMGLLPIALAFGLTVTAMAYTVGAVSGAHLNPAVTAAFVVAGRMAPKEALGYMLAQVGGATFAAWLLMFLQGQFGLGANGLGQTVFKSTPFAAGLLEFITTFVFITVILRTTRQGLPLAGLVIGLTLITIILVAGAHTGMSANPARSFGPALFVGGQAMAQLWVYVVATFAAGLAAGVMDKVCASCCCTTDGSCKKDGEGCKKEGCCKA